MEYGIDKPKETVQKYGTCNMCGDKNVLVQSFERRYGCNFHKVYIDWLCVDCVYEMKKALGIPTD